MTVCGFRDCETKRVAELNWRIPTRFKEQKYSSLTEMSFKWPLKMIWGYNSSRSVCAHSVGTCLYALCKIMKCNKKKE